MSRPIRKVVAAVAITVGTTGGLAGTAFAASNGSSSPSTAPSTSPSGGSSAPSGSSSSTDAGRLHEIQARAKAAIDARLHSLNFAIAAVKANRVITDADKDTLLNTLNGDVSGLTALEAKIQGDTTVAQAEADYKTIFSGYRVYALALPQVLFAAATDDITQAVLPHLNDADSRLTTLLNGKYKDKDTPPVQAAMKDLAAQINAITVSTKGLSAQVLAYTPAQWNANHGILGPPRQTLRTARADVRTGRADIAFVVAQIKS